MGNRSGDGVVRVRVKVKGRGRVLGRCDARRAPIVYW